MLPIRTRRKCRNVRIFPELGVDWLCHPPAAAVALDPGCVVFTRPRPEPDNLRQSTHYWMRTESRGEKIAVVGSHWRSGDDGRLKKMECHDPNGCWISAVSMWVMPSSMPRRSAATALLLSLRSMYQVPCPMIVTSGPLTPNSFFR
jgi:hypothetical protein